MLLLSLVLLLVSSMSASGAVVEVISLLDVQGEGNPQLILGIPVIWRNIEVVYSFLNRIFNQCNTAFQPGRIC